jgi:ribosomal protein L13
MLPKNRLRSRLIKNLVLFKGSVYHGIHHDPSKT